MDSHRLNDPVAYPHPKMLYVAVVTENLLEELITGDSNDALPHLLHGDVESSPNCAVNWNRVGG